MRTVIEFIGFIAAMTLAGIGCSEESFLTHEAKILSLIVGLFFAVIILLAVMTDSKRDLV